MAFHSGKSGDVKFGSATVHVGNWKITQSAVMGNTTNSGSGGNSTFIPGNKSWKGSFELPWDDAALVSTGGYVAGASGSATFNLGDSTMTLVGTILIAEQGFEDEAVEGQPVKVNVAFQGTGPLTNGG